MALQREGKKISYRASNRATEEATPKSEIHVSFAPYGLYYGQRYSKKEEAVTSPLNNEAILKLKKKQRKKMSRIKYLN